MKELLGYGHGNWAEMRKRICTFCIKHEYACYAMATGKQ
jgi:hypothetical protein